MRKISLANTRIITYYMELLIDLQVLGRMQINTKILIPLEIHCKLMKPA